MEIADGRRSKWRLSLAAFHDRRQAKIAEDCVATIVYKHVSLERMS